MALLVLKLFSEKNKTNLDTSVAAYKAGAGAALLTAQRGMDSAVVFDGNAISSHVGLVLAHAGLAVPAAAGKLADLQHVYVEEDKLVDAQAALDAALEDVIHEEAIAADINTTVAGTITSTASTPFVAGDVGRKISVAGVSVVITAFTDTNNVDYDITASEGTLASATGQSADRLGAEVLQDINLSIFKEPDGDYRFALVLACSGEASA